MTDSKSDSSWRCRLSDGLFVFFKFFYKAGTTIIVLVGQGTMYVVELAIRYIIQPASYLGVHL